MRLKGFEAFLILLVALAASSCKEPEGIGLDVLPDGEQMPLAWDDTFTIEARTVYYDSVPTSNIGTYVIGDFGDPIFGSVRSTFYTKYAFEQSDYDFSNAQIDSVVLNLTYSGSYGNTDKLKGTMTFGVFEVAEDLLNTQNDTTYYSHSSPMLGGQIGELTFRPDLYANRELIFDGDTATLSPALRIRLDDAFGQRLLTESNTSSNDVFWETFKGLAVKPLSTSMPGFGSILYFNMGSSQSRLELYYHTPTDTFQELLKIENPNGLHTRFEHDYSTEIISAIDDSTVSGATRLYTQSLAGLRMRLLFPHIKELNNLGAIAINKAELVIPIDESVVTDYSYPPTLSVTGINAGDSAVFLTDFFEGTDYFGGTRNAENSEYVFNIARYLQAVLNAPEEVDYGLYVSNTGNAVNGYRGVYNGPGHPTTPMKLRITYTIIE